MASFLADENITRPAIKGLNKAGLATVHIKYDLKLGGIEDSRVFAEGKKRKLTILTDDNRDFKSMKKTDLKSGSGVWCLQTNIVKKQIERAEKIRKIGNFYSKKSRKGSLVIATNKSFTYEDCKTRKKIKYSFKNFIE